MPTAMNEETILELTALLTGRPPSECAPFTTLSMLELQGRLKEPDRQDSRLDYLAASLAAWRSVLADGTREERELTPAGTVPSRTGQSGREGAARRFLEECLLACSSLLRDEGPFFFRQTSCLSPGETFPGKLSQSTGLPAMETEAASLKAARFLETPAVSEDSSGSDQMNGGGFPGPAR